MKIVTFMQLFHKIQNSSNLSNKGKLKAFNRLDSLRWSESTEEAFTKKDFQNIAQYSDLLNPIHINTYDEVL